MQKEMKRTIWKFPLNIADIQKINMPKKAKILTVQSQNGTPCLWAIVNPNEDLEERIIEIYGTGHEIDFTNEDYEKHYIGTYQHLNAMLVWHVFEIKKAIKE